VALNGALCHNRTDDQKISGLSCLPVTSVAARHPDFIRLQKALLDPIAPELRRAFRGRRCSSKGGI
jgi:hypothetical protein